MTAVVPSIAALPGFQTAGVHCGLKQDGALDMALIVSDRPCTAAGIFTTNLVKAAPLQVCIKALEANPTAIRAIAINTGSANACTGDQGLANACATADYVASRIGCTPVEVLVLSTGVIGTQLPMDRIRYGVDAACASLGDDWPSAARAIMTTDTRPKYASVQIQLENGQSCTIAGISKGSGMIAPNMATMLGILVTDATLSPDHAQDMLRAAADRSFNRIVVDGDMSTNDTVFLLANGASGVTLGTDADRAAFQAGLDALCATLAKAIVRDGEGVTKFITLRVTGMQSNQAAHTVANTIATSALVKTAFYGNDANWGRIIAAAGRSGIPLEPDRLRLSIAPGSESQSDGLLLFAAGMPTNYSESEATAFISQPEVTIHLDGGVGSGSTIVWTCDLSHNYVSINGHYRT